MQTRSGTAHYSSAVKINNHGLLHSTILVEKTHSRDSSLCNKSLRSLGFFRWTLNLHNTRAFFYTRKWHPCRHLRQGDAKAIFVTVCRIETAPSVWTDWMALVRKSLRTGGIESGLLQPWGLNNHAIAAMVSFTKNPRLCSLYIYFCFLF